MLYFSPNMLPYITPGNKKTIAAQLLHALIKRASEEQVRCILKALPERYKRVDDMKCKTNTGIYPLA